MGEISERFSGGTQRCAEKGCVAQRRRQMANDQKHLLVIARSAQLRPTLFVYDPEAYEAWIKSGGLIGQQQQNHN